MLDEMDVKILRILQQDCTKPVAEIGKLVIRRERPEPHDGLQFWTFDRSHAAVATDTAEIWNRTHPDHPVRYVREDRPGLARAHNAALPHVTGSVLAFTDDDVEVEPDWLSAMMMSRMKFEGAAGAAGAGFSGVMMLCGG